MMWKFKGHITFINIKMSHYIIKIKLYDKYIEIHINKNIKELNNNEIINIYKNIITIKNYEIKNGNEIINSQLYISYIKNMLVKEYINIFSIIRYGTYIEIYKYFKNFNEIKNTQNTNTNININEYLDEYNNIKQIIIINFLFNIKINNLIIKEEIKKIEKILKINNLDIEEL